jgi:PAS domain S-box-containing protein
VEVDSVGARIIVGAATSAVAVVARLLLAPVLGDTVPFLLYFPAVVVAASVGGHWTGLLTVAICSVAQALIFEAPAGSTAVGDPGAALRLLLFAINGAVISVITGATFESRRSALRSSRVAEQLYEAEAAARQSVETAEQRTRVLYETAAALSDAVTPEDVADVMIRQGVVALGATAGAVVLVTEDRTRVRVLRAHGYPEDYAAAAAEAPLDAGSATATAIRTGQPVFVEGQRETTERYPFAAGALAATGAEALVAVPLGSESAPFGALVLTFPDRREFPLSQREFHMALGHECAQALERARLFRAEQQARRAAEQGSEAERRARAEADEARLRVALLADVSAVLSSSLDYEVTLQHVAELVVPRLGDWVAIDLVGANGAVRSVALAHVDADGLSVLREYRERFPPDTHLTGSIETIRTGKTVLIPNVSEEDAARSAEPDAVAFARPLEIHSYLSVPLRGSDNTLGALVFSSRVRGRYGPAEVSIAEDIARRAAATIEHSNLFRDARQFIATVDATLDAVFMFEPSTLRFTYVNQGAIAQVGYDRTDLLSMRAIDIKPDFDEPRYRQILAPLIDGSRDHITFSTVHRHREGYDIPVEVFLQHVRLPGGEARMIITSRDIRAQIDVQASLYRLARAERSRAAELSAVIQGMSDGVLVCDADGRVVLSNQAVASILGEPVDGFAELLSRLEPAEGEMPALGVSTPPVEMRLRDQDRWIELGSARVATDAGDPMPGAGSTILVIRDVTAARNVQAAREAFIGVLSHELRTPITTIYGNTKIMRRVADPAVHADMLADVEAEADRLYRLVEDLLILSRAETGLRLEGEPVLLQHLIPAVLAAERAHWPGHAFEDRVPPGLPPAAADRTYLEQVIRNLITNAAKYGREGGLVEVHADVDGDAVTVRVLDQGPGVPAGEEERVFDLFYRSAASSRRVSGAGIGLYVCRALVEGMGGRIWTRRRPEGGGEFGFTVPVLSVHDDDVIGDESEESQN